MGHLRRKVERGAVWTLLLHGVSMLVELSITVILARLLSPYDFGIAAAAMLFMGFIYIFSEIGVAPTIVRIDNLNRNDLRAALTICLGVSALCVILTYVSSPWVASALHMPEAAGPLRALSVIFLFRGVSTISEAKLQRDLSVKEYKIAQILARMFGYGLFSAAFAWLGYGYWSIVYGAIIEEGLRAVALSVIARIPLSFTFKIDQLKRVAGSSVGFTAVTLVNFFALNGDTAIVARATDAVSTGLYSRAFKLMSFPTTLYSRVADQVIFPAFANLQSNPDRLRNAFLEATTLSALIGLPLSVMIVMLGPNLILFLYGDEWTSAIPVFAGLSLGAFARFATRTSGSALRAVGAVRPMLVC